MSDITSQQLVVFSIGREEYALPIRAVHQIIRYTEPRSIPADASVDPRGDRPPRQDHPDRRARRAPRYPGRGERVGKIVIVETGAGHAGLIVGEVDEVFTYHAGPARGRPTAVQTCASIAKIGDRLVILLTPRACSRPGSDELTAAGPRVAAIMNSGAARRRR